MPTIRKYSHGDLDRNTSEHLIFLNRTHYEKLGARGCVLLCKRLTLFSGHITEIRAICCCFRKLVGGAVANSLLDLIGRFLPICIIEHIR